VLSDACTIVALVLEELRISGLGVIADASLPLGPGLTVITGETGAGKTMVVAGLGLLFGGRADAARVRAEPGRAVVEGLLRLGADAREALRTRLDEAGVEFDDGALVLTRMVNAEGRSRAHAGGRTVPVAVLGEIGEHALTVHGQSDQLRLLRPAEQRAALDRYAGPPHEKRLKAYREAYDAWCRVGADLARRRREARERLQELELLRLGLDEIGRVDPRPGEDVELREEACRLEHAEGLRAAALGAYRALGPGEADDALTMLGAARHDLAASAGLDPVLAGLAARIAEAAALAADTSAELRAYVDALDADPDRLAAVHERRAALRALTLRYAEDVDGVLAWAERARARYDELDASEEALAHLEAERAALEAEVAGLAAEVSAARREAADRFAEAVTAELVGLAMPHARVEVAVTPHPAGELRLVLDGVDVGVGPDGADDVEVRLRPHAGSPALALQKGASGGELSRVMLAVEVVFAGSGGMSTLVFDEVDAGVGGQAAMEVGRRLARLARTHQVLAVTHLPQVAAFADQHLVVEKDGTGSVSESGVREVCDSERARELARMLAGLPDSDLGIAHAEELLALARSSPPPRSRRS